MEDQKKTKSKTGQAGPGNEYPPIPGLITTDELLWFYPSTGRTIGRRQQDGIIKRVGTKFPTAETLRALLTYHREQSDAKDRLLSLKADDLQMDVDVKRRELISIEEQEDWLRIVVGTIANELSGMPAKFAKNFQELGIVTAQERLSVIADTLINNLMKRFERCRENAKKGKVQETEA